MLNERRAIIIGAGPGGCAAAIHLRRAGVATMILESRPFPRVKVCGEFIAPAATNVLESLIAAGDLHRLGGKRVDRFVLECGNRERVWTLPNPAWAISRSTLDDALLDIARSLGATIIQPGTVRRAEFGEASAAVELADGREIVADVIIHADGSGRHDPRGPTPMAPGWVGQKCHFQPPAAAIDGVRIRTCRGAYVGTVAVDGGIATCALAVRSSELGRFGGDADRLLSAIWPKFDPHWRRGPWHSCGVARGGYRRPGHWRSLRVGNAAAAVDPVGGEGIGLALWAGAALARALGASAWTSESLTSIESQFEADYRRKLRTRLPACRFAAELLVRPWIARSLWWALEASDLTMWPWFRLTGKLDAAEAAQPLG